MAFHFHPLILRGDKICMLRETIISDFIKTLLCKCKRRVRFASGRFPDEEVWSSSWPRCEDAVSTAVTDTVSRRQRSRLRGIDYFISADEQLFFFRAGRCSLPTSAGRYTLRFSMTILNHSCCHVGLLEGSDKRPLLSPKLVRAFLVLTLFLDPPSTRTPWWRHRQRYQKRLRWATGEPQRENSNLFTTVTIQYENRSYFY